MGPFPRLGIGTFILCLLGAAPLAANECTPGVAIPTSLPELAFRPDTFKPYFVGVSSDAALFRAVSREGPHCRVEGASTRWVDLHPFIAPGDGDVVAPVPLAAVHVAATLDIRPPVPPPARRCNYADIDGDPARDAECFHASQSPASMPEDVAKWTARVRVIRTGTDFSVSEYDRTIWINLAELGIDAGTPLAQIVETTTQFVEEKNWANVIGLFPVAVFAQSPYNFTITDPHGRQAGFLAANDIPYATYVTYGTESMVVVPAPEDGLYLLDLAAAPRTRLTLSMARVDYSKALGRPVVDEIAGDEFPPFASLTFEAVPRYALLVTPPPSQGLSPYKRLLNARADAQQFWNRDVLLPPALGPASDWVNEYRLSRTGQFVLKGQAYLVGELTDKKRSRQEREWRSGRDPHAYDHIFDAIIDMSWSTSRELALRGLMDAAAYVRTDRAARRMNAAWQYFVLAEQYAADGDPTTSIERYLYAFTEARFLLP